MDFYPLKLVSAFEMESGAFACSFQIPENLAEVFTFDNRYLVYLGLAGKGYGLYRLYTGRNDRLVVCSSSQEEADLLRTAASSPNAERGFLVSAPMDNYSLAAAVSPPEKILAFTDERGLMPSACMLRHLLSGHTDLSIILYCFPGDADPMILDQLSLLKNDFPDRLQLSMQEFNPSAENFSQNQYLSGVLNSISAPAKIWVFGSELLNKAIRSISSSCGISIHSAYVYPDLRIFRSENLETSGSGIVRVRLVLDCIFYHIIWTSPLTLLHAILNSGIDVPYSCGKGSCGTCVCMLNDGEVQLGRNYVLSDAHVRAGVILPCVCRTKGQEISISYDEIS